MTIATEISSVNVPTQFVEVSNRRMADRLFGDGPQHEHPQMGGDLITSFVANVPASSSTMA